MYGYGVLLALGNHGVNVVSNTLRSYVERGLVDPPEGARQDKKGSWFGLGLNAIYKDETPAEAFAAHALLNEDHLTPETVKHCRILGHYIERTNIQELRDLLDDTELRVLIQKSADIIGWKPSKVVFFAFEWIAARHQFEDTPVMAILNEVRSLLMQLVDDDDYAWAVAFPERAAAEQEEMDKADPWTPKHD